MVKLVLQAPYMEVPVTIGNFPDGTLHMSVDRKEAQEGNFLAIEWYYESEAELSQVIQLRKAFSDRCMDLFLPYVPNARQDRVKNLNDVFTLKTFAEVINWLDFNEVHVLDVHSPVALALIDRVVEHSPQVYINRAWSEIVEKNNGEAPIFFYPDEGAMKRYSDTLPIPYAFGIKKRDWGTGKILSLDVINREQVKGKNVLIIDDICSRGGTFFHSANTLKNLGAKNIYLYITHAEDTMYNGEMFLTPGLIKHIYTTNSIAKDYQKERVTVYDIAW